ncbi:MAG: hypothetical protein ACRDXX_22545, partial [Stackebrandtia sp.]
MNAAFDDIAGITTKRQLGAWLRTRMNDLGLRVEDVAGDLEGVSQATVYNWLKGASIPKPPKGDGLDRFYRFISHPDLALPEAQRLALDQVRTRLTGDAVAHRPDRPRRGLPGDVAQFTGRQDQLKRLDKLLRAHRRANAALVAVLSGMGGVGKTALAVRWAHTKPVLDVFADGFLYINLRGFSASPPSTSQAALNSLLRQLGVDAAKIPGDVDAMAALYQEILSGKTMMIVLDNAHDEPQVRPLLPADPGCLAVVTSRHDLHGLAVSHDAALLRLDQLPSREAAALLRRLLPAGVPAADVDAMATAGGRLPLALRIAAAAYL